MPNASLALELPCPKPHPTNRTEQQVLPQHTDPEPQQVLPHAIPWRASGHIHEFERAPVRLKAWEGPASEHRDNDIAQNTDCITLPPTVLCIPGNTGY